MKAIITKEQSKSLNYGVEKETVSRYIVLGKINGEMREVVDCRVYMGRSRNASTVYASVWITGDKHTSGHGNAGGYGYHKESAAIEDAIRSAGIELYGSPYSDESGKVYGDKENLKSRVDFGGCGETAQRVALLAVARAAGAKGKLIFVG